MVNGATFGQCIRGRRKEFGMSTEQLASKIGITKSYLGRIEIGERRPPVGELLDRFFEVLAFDQEEKDALTAMADSGRNEINYCKKYRPRSIFCSRNYPVPYIDAAYEYYAHPTKGLFLNKEQVTLGCDMAFALMELVVENAEKRRVGNKTYLFHDEDDSLGYAIKVVKKICGDESEYGVPLKAIMAKIKQFNVNGY